MFAPFSLQVDYKLLLSGLHQACSDLEIQPVQPFIDKVRAYLLSFYFLLLFFIRDGPGVHACVLHPVQPNVDEVVISLRSFI